MLANSRQSARTLRRRALGFAKNGSVDIEGQIFALRQRNGGGTSTNPAAIQVLHGEVTRALVALSDASPPDQMRTAVDLVRREAELIIAMADPECQWGAVRAELGRIGEAWQRLGDTRRHIHLLRMARMACDGALDISCLESKTDQVERPDEARPQSQAESAAMPSVHDWGDKSAATEGISVEVSTINLVRRRQVRFTGAAVAALAAGAAVYLHVARPVSSANVERASIDTDDFAGTATVRSISTNVNHAKRGTERIVAGRKLDDVAKPTVVPPSQISVGVSAEKRLPVETRDKNLVALVPITVTASSFFVYGAERHPPEHAFDGNSSTAWNEAHGMPGQGAWIEAQFAAPQHIRSVKISAGYDAISPKHGDLFALNRHAKRLTLLFDGTAPRTIEVGQQQRQVSLGNLDLMVTRLRVVIDEIWDGTKWQDMCISEVVIQGEPQSALAGSKMEMAETPKEAAIVEKSPTAPDGMVFVPNGTFTMGSDEGRGSEKPQRKVTLSRSFFIDKTEVSSANYQRCVSAGACQAASIHGPAAGAKAVAELSHRCTGGDPARSSHPINCVDLAQAEAYCRWQNKRLPTDAEWEYAARGTDGRNYPWGEGYSGCSQADVGGCANGTVAVGTRANNESPFGAMDMAGNVWEWVADGCDDAPAERAGTTDPHLPASKTLGVLRGGSWDFSAPYARTFSRLKFSAASGHVSTGVRCAKDNT